MNENKKEEKLTKSFYVLIIVISILLIVGIAAGFFSFINREEKVINKTKSGGNIVLNYSDDTNGLRLINAVATTDEMGKKDLTEGDYFDFSVDVDLDNASEVQYEISLTKNSESSTINDKDIRIYLEQEDSGTYNGIFGPESFLPLKSKTKLGSKKGSLVVAKVKKTKSSTDNYRLRIWLNEKAIVTDGSYSVEVNINGKAK